MRKTIIWGALLHDIGKFISCGFSEEQEIPGVSQQKIGAEWARKAGLSAGIAEIIEQANVDTKHNALKIDIVDESIGQQFMQNILYAVYEADCLASGTVEPRSDSALMIGEIPGLQPVFASIFLNGTRKHDFSKTFWEAKNIADMPYPKQDVSDLKQYQAFYRQQAKAFEKEFQENVKTLDEDTLLLLLQKYTINFPEYGCDSTNADADTSLYHHLRSTAAITWCLYRYLQGGQTCDWENDSLQTLIKNRSDHKYLMIAGDFSGIQNFIYTTSSRGALKTVRARSFYLELLAETAVSHILEMLNLPRACIIYSSGGGFFILAPNTGDTVEALQHFEKSFNDYLYQQHGLSLYLCMAWKSLNGDTFLTDSQGDNHLPEVWEDLKIQLAKNKERKWETVMMGDFDQFFAPRLETTNCDICHQAVSHLKNWGDEDEENDLQICPFCFTMLQLGKKLPDSQRIYKVNASTQGDVEIFGHIYAFHIPKGKAYQAVYLLHDLWKLQPGENKQRNFPQGSYYSNREFQGLMEDAAGFARIGILRMDVDYLGKIFARGLGGKANIGRLSDLSERFNLYFKFYLPRRLTEVVDRRISRRQADAWRVNLIYAGGDDLFLVGAWNDALDISWFIQEDFKRYTGNHPEISLSGGMVIAESKMAFYRMAEESGQEEKRAKNNGRNSLSIFGYPLKWDEVAGQEHSKGKIRLEDLMIILAEKGLDPVRRRKPVAFSRSFLQNLRTLCLPVPGEDASWAYPRIHYLFASSMRSLEGRKYENTFYRPLFSMLLQEDVIRTKALPALQIIDYLTRGGE